MARLFDRIKESCTSPGTGNVTLLGAPAGYRAFSAVFSVGDNYVPYVIADQSGSNWEVGYGTYSASNTLTRDTVLASSNSNNSVNFSTGSQDVFLSLTADAADETGRVIMLTRGGAMP